MGITMLDERAIRWRQEVELSHITKIRTFHELLKKLELWEQVDGRQMYHDDNGKPYTKIAISMYARLADVDTIQAVICTQAFVAVNDLVHSSMRIQWRTRPEYEVLDARPYCSRDNDWRLVSIYMRLNAIE
jgi:nanoRNase/pAp phosphatase (c-di-AMP/oligoRNAs hydrolase)